MRRRSSKIDTSYDLFRARIPAVFYVNLSHNRFPPNGNRWPRSIKSEIMKEMTKQMKEKPNIEGDRINLFLLVLMYTFQGVVSGFSHSFPIIFQQNKRVSYADQVGTSVWLTTTNGAKDLLGWYRKYSSSITDMYILFVLQAEFSFAVYPFCFKLLWAPIVDCVFSKRFGRRKTWIIPMQYLMGIVIEYT